MAMQFEEYNSLTSIERMHARLQGLAEILNASGMRLLKEGEHPVGDTGDNWALGDQTTGAFSEDGLPFSAESDRDAASVTLSLAQVRVLERRFGLQGGELAQAIEALGKDS